jgi:hypothetical protein
MKVKELQDLEVVLGRRYDLTEHNIYRTKEIFTVGKIALNFIERWGMVAAVPDGEDSTGRSKSRLMTEEEVVNRAVKTATLLWEKFQELDWFLDVPLPQKREEI